jgi:hypothetical protein
VRLAGGLQQRFGGLAPLVDGPGQGGQDGESFPGAGVHAGLAVPGGLALVDLLCADGAWNGPGGPPAGFLDGPLRQVQVESPHRGQALAVADPVDG